MEAAQPSPRIFCSSLREPHNGPSACGFLGPFCLTRHRSSALEAGGKAARFGRPAKAGERLRALPYGGAL